MSPFLLLLVGVGLCLTGLVLEQLPRLLRWICLGAGVGVLAAGGARLVWPIF